MQLTPTAYYQACLAALHRQLLAHEVTQRHLSGTGIRYDGVPLDEASTFDFDFATLSTVEFAHLFSIFDGSRVHSQAENKPSRDDAPPGMYFTVINTKTIQNEHKNKSGIFTEDSGSTGLFIDGLHGMHIDHFFLNERKTPPSLGTFAFTLCAITAHLAGLDHISLIAAGGKGFSPRHIGFKVWPKLGFDADLLPGETDGAPPHLQGCHTVQQAVTADAAWWDEHGSQRLMTFDLAADSVSWQKLVPYASEKAFA